MRGNYYQESALIDSLSSHYPVLKEMRWNIPRAANIRCIEGYKGAPLMFEKLLPTMSVSFVHNGQLTVLPFSFKYLREYVNNL